MKKNIHVKICLFVYKCDGNENTANVCKMFDELPCKITFSYLHFDHLSTETN